jgi:3-phosphoshikimate 1-carboxyvinyltransferase
MKYKLLRPDHLINTSVRLPASKSISNRLLLIHALAGNTGGIINLSDSDDTVLMQDALRSEKVLKDIGHAGTAMRFLTAFYSCREGRVTITGSARMKERPIGPLVDALRLLGADIEYSEKDGCPPLIINGRRLAGGEIEIPGNISSQFISALLMVAPTFEKGLVLHLSGDIVSSSYIHMTLKLMQQHGAKYKWEGNTISVSPGSYTLIEYHVESDWSAASYWYAMMLAPLADQISLSILGKESLQGDSDLVNIFTKLGIRSTFEKITCRLDKGRADHDLLFKYDFTNSPDLVQSMAVICCMGSIPFKFEGTQTLRIKETDRITALQNELLKLGFILKSDPGATFLAWNGDRCTPETNPVISTYHDHRMAMAFAPAALFMDEICIDDPMVVTKSYPAFWEDLKHAGFSISQD